MNTEKTAIALHGDNPPQTIADDRVYFTFASGRLDHDCESCGALCCRGHSYNICSGRELDNQLRARPALRFFIELRDASAPSVYTVRNCAPACFFLTADNRCDVHERFGHDAKPETCRLFPFNYIRRAGPYLIVSPHLSLCPLAVLHSGAWSDRSCHDQQLENLRTGGVGTLVRRVDPIEGNLSALVALERSIVAASEAHLDAPDYAAFAELQESAAHEALPSLNRPGGAPPGAGRETFIGLLCEVLGVTPDVVRRPSPDVLRCLVAATPALRAELVFGDWRTRPGAALVDLTRIPRALLVLCAIVELASRAGMSAITFQTVMRLFSENLPLLAILAHADSEIAWKTSHLIDLRFAGPQSSRRQYLAIVQALLPGRRTRKPLGRILSDHLYGDDLDRTMLLRQLAGSLMGRIRPCAAAEPAVAWRHRVRPAIQHWVLGALPPPTLLRLATT